MPTVADYARDYLISEGLVRKPRDAGASTVYPMWINPREGAPGARNPNTEDASVETNDDLVTSAFSTTNIPVERGEGYKRVAAVEFWLRGRTYPLIEDFWLRLRPRFVDKNGAEGKRGWSMGGLYVLESLWLTELQRLGSDELGWNYTAEVTLEVFQP